MYKFAVVQGMTDDDDDDDDDDDRYVIMLMQCFICYTETVSCLMCMSSVQWTAGRTDRHNGYTSRVIGCTNTSQQSRSIDE